MSRGSGKTIAPRIRISLYGDESARCSDSNRLDLPSASSACSLLRMAKRGCGSLSAQPWLHPGLDPPWVAVVCHALDDQGLYWFEEPIAYDNLASYAQLARELKTPVQLGENFYGPRSLFQTIREKSGDYVMFDLMRIGGVTGWLQAAAIAGAAGIEVSTHLYPEVAAHFVRLTETAHWLEWQDWANPILAEPFRLEDGHLLIPDRPGSGIEWNEGPTRRLPPP